MPCQYESHEEAATRWSRERDDLTRWLCAALKHIVKIGRPMPDEPGLLEWWNAHQEADRRREALARANERLRYIREIALAKLSPEERDALKA